jgi:hypothetical protein
MVKVAPAPPRATITETPGEMRIVVPAWRHTFGIVFGGVLLAVWLLTEPLLVGALFAGLWAVGRGLPDVDVPAGGVVFYVAVLLLWTALGLLTLAGWLWAVAGKDVVTVTDRTVMLKRDVFGRGPTRSCDLARVRALRVMPWWEYHPWAIDGRRPSMFQSRGPIALDYDGRTTQFASGVNEAEAFRIVDRIRARFGIPAGEPPEDR